MVTVKVRKISNPHHRKRKMSAKQVAIFGTRRQKAALKAKRHNARTKSNPPARAKNKTRANRHHHRRSTPRKRNTALVVTLGSVANPRKNKRRNKVAAAARKTNRRRRYNTHHRRRRNTTAKRNTAHRNRTKMNPARRTNRRRHHHRRRNAVGRRRNTKMIVMKPNRRHHHRRRNPLNTELFGNPLFGKNSLELVGGGLLGLVAAKFIPTLFPSSITGGVASSSIGRVVISGIASVVGAWAGSKVSPLIGQGMLFGGMIQTFSIALNAFLPQVYGQLNPSLGRLGRFGDLTPGAFTIPQNPILMGRQPAMLPPAAQMAGGGGQVRMTANGLGRAYGSAY